MLTASLHTRRWLFLGLLLCAAGVLWGGADPVGLAPAAAGPANLTPSPSRTPGTPSPSRTPGTPTPVPHSPTPRPSPTPTVCPAGSHWDVIESPNNGNTNSLYGVAVAGANEAWAVGLYYQDGSVVKPQIQHWNGSAWTMGAVPEIDTGLLQGVTVIAPDDVWAVGTQAGFLANL